MITYDIARAKDAVQKLVDATYFAHHCKKLRSSVKRPRILPFKEELETLNELIIIGRQSEEAMENLIAVAEFKRDNRNDYQRKFMATARARERRIIALEEALRRVVLNPDQRRELILKQKATWDIEKEVFMQASHNSYTEQFGVPPGHEQKIQHVKEFWAFKDMELSMMEEQAQRIAVHQEAPKKRLVLVEAKTPSHSQISQKLMDVLDKRK